MGRVPALYFTTAIADPGNRLNLNQSSAISASNRSSNGR